MAVSLSGVEEHGLGYHFDNTGRLGSVFNTHAKVLYSYHPAKQLLSQQAFQNASSQTIVQGTRLYDAKNRLKSIS